MIDYLVVQRTEFDAQSCTNQDKEKPEQLYDKMPSNTPKDSHKQGSHGEQYDKHRTHDESME